ncbi:MAG TPA: hypothetical protein VFE98_05855 [Candidatus Bathyarchaeia archaeon]|nr:hypothetical protein [Candidatus Bathyarchaeia archaeon]
MAGSPTITMGGSIFRSHRKRNIAILALLAVSVVGLSIVASEFATANTVTMHWHPHLSVVINGNPTAVPAQIGIAPNLYFDHSLDRYGMSGMSPLHTHDASGTIHEESNTMRDFTLQDFLRVWGQSVDSSQVLGHPVDAGHRAYVVVDGVQMSPSSTVVLKDGEQIRIVCGP